MYIKEKIEDNTGIGIIVILGFFLLVVTILWITVGYPIWTVWDNKKMGEAELARAESNRQIKTLEAKALMESAKHLADAEIIRAKGVAEANKIIGESLKDNEGYLRYLWITNLESSQKEVIYIPTETNLPILEANRLRKE